MNQFQQKELEKNVVNAGICFGCGACVAMDQSEESEMVDSDTGPIPLFTGNADFCIDLKDVCPGYGCDYPSLYKKHYSKLPENWLLGNLEKVRVGHAKDESIRQLGASGGVLTRVLIYMLESGEVDAVIVAEQGSPTPLQARFKIVTTREEIINCAQSIYIQVSMLDSLKLLEPNKRYAMVCLPDQSAALRSMQHLGNERALQIKYVVGPYVGTSLQPGALKAFLRSNKVDKNDDVLSLKWRAGEWPGYLEIRTKSGRVIRSKKVYYNYLIPFFITQGSLQSMDFVNEFADLSVGDAWSPKYEKEGGGFSVVVTRTGAMERIIEEMIDANLLSASEIDPLHASDMHGHMLDFKKRGSWLRNKWRKAVGLRAPDFGYAPKSIGRGRVLVEMVICSIFIMARNPVARGILTLIPERYIGPLFNQARLTWKSISRPTKRKGLSEIEIVVRD